MEKGVPGKKELKAFSSYLQKEGEKLGQISALIR